MRHDRRTVSIQGVVTIVASESIPAPETTGTALGNRPEGGPVFIVGYDGSDTARVALDYAARRARAGGRLVVVNAYAPPASWFGAASYQRPDDSKAAADQGHSVLEEIHPDLLAGIEVEREDVRASPPRAILDAAHRHGADEIVVGAHGRWPMRPGLGSVASAVVSQAKIPVVVVPSS
ncbi:MAG: universal stress protein [Solirubrobacteraceae bacterium]